MNWRTFINENAVSLDGDTLDALSDTLNGSPLWAFSMETGSWYHAEIEPDMFSKAKENERLEARKNKLEN